MFRIVHRRREERLFAPLLPLVEGHTVADGPGRRAVEGSHRGRPLRAAYVRGDALFDSGSPKSGALETHMFDLIAEAVPGAADWGVTYERDGSGLGARHWRTVVSDPELEARLLGAGVMELLDAAGAFPQVRYEAGPARLTLREEMAPRRVPTAEGFAAQLALLDQVVALNFAVNPPPGLALGPP